jgi:hypothetical protein
VGLRIKYTVDIFVWFDGELLVLSQVVAVV